MALLNANYMGLYALSKSSTEAYAVGVGNTVANAVADAWSELGNAAGHAILVDADDDVYEESSRPAIKAIAGSSSSNFTGMDLNLVAAATNTSLDLSNSQTEVVARDGSCGSETFIVSGAQNWSLQADGLIQSGAVSGYGAMSLMDIARKSEYVFVRFVLNNQSMDDSADNDENVSYIGQALVENVTISGGFDETQTYSCTLNGYGKLYKYQS